jgi:hypothetical protein
LKKIIFAAVRSTLSKVRTLQRTRFSSIHAEEDKLARAREVERLDRIRNPRKYRPNQDE